MSAYLPEVEAIAREAGALLMEHFARRVVIEYKGDVDLVTAADRASENLIVERLRSRWPEHDLVGEEGARSDTGADYRWYVDPLDGTTNFAHGYPVFCVSIALVRKDEQLEVGVLYDPTRDEMFASERGQGARLNGKTNSRFPDSDSFGVDSGDRFPQPQASQESNIHCYHQITLRSHGVRRAGSAALDLANVACGRYDGFWEFNLNPWDTAAGARRRAEPSPFRRLALPPRQPRGPRQQRPDPPGTLDQLRGNLRRPCLEGIDLARLSTPRRAPAAVSQGFRLNSQKPS